MNIKVKNLSQDINGYIEFTVVIDEKQEIICNILYRDIDIGDSHILSEISKDTYNIIWNFANDLREKVRENTRKYLKEMEQIIT